MPITGRPGSRCLSGLAIINWVLILNDQDPRVEGS
jgi:hypothetical protein